MELGNVVTIIPAKGGSTRLKRKNLLKINNKPLIAFPIQNAINAGICGRIIVSTEDEEISNVAKDYGAEVPFLRPGELARDPATVSDVCLHALDQIESANTSYDTMIILLPTAPLCTHHDIFDAFKLYKDEGVHYLMSVTPLSSPPFNALRYRDDGKTLTPCFPDSDFKHTKSTECPKTLKSNGAICIANIQSFKSNRTLWGDTILGYEMPQEKSIDIDNALDLEIARLLYNQIYEKP